MPWDRLLLGFGSACVIPVRVPKIAIALRPSTLSQANEISRTDFEAPIRKRDLAILQARCEREYGTGNHSPTVMAG